MSGFFVCKFLMKRGENDLLIEGQIIEVTWNPATRSWYEGLGYKWTKCGDKFLIPVKDLHPGSSIKVCVTCDFCGAKHQKQYRKITHDKSDIIACQDCSSKKVNYNDLKQRQKDQMDKFYSKCDDFNLIPLSKYEDYYNTRSQVYYKCNRHGENHSMYMDFIKSKYGCQQCARDHTKQSLMIDVSKVKEIVEAKNKNTLLNPKDYKGHHVKNLLVRCGTCGEAFKTSLSSIEASDGHCPSCGARKSHESQRLSYDEVEQRINSVNGNILLNKEEYTRNNALNLRIRCSCGNIFVTSLANYGYSRVNRCPVCTQRTSSGEILVSHVLDTYNIDYETEYWFDDCRGDVKPLPFDFYIKDKKTIIEFDGPHHYRPIFDEQQYERTVRYDAIKNKYCEDNNINLIRIPYWERDNIQTIITQGLGLDIDKTA